MTTNKLIVSKLSFFSLLALLILATPVHSQGVARTEDYEGYSLGPLLPTTTGWYTSTIEANGGTSTIVSPGLNGTDQALELECRGGCTSNVFRTVRYTLTEAFQPETVEFYFQIVDRFEIQAANAVSFQDSSGNVGFYFRAADSGTIEFNTAAFGVCSGASSQEGYSSPNAPHKFVITFDWDAQSYIMDIDDGAVTHAKPFCQTASNLSNFCLTAGASGPNCSDSGGLGLILVDQIQFDGGQIPPGPPEPCDFLDPNNSCQDLADELNIPVAALDTWISWMLVFIFMAAGFMMARGIGASIGAGAGIIIAFALGRFSLTFLFFTGMLAVAAGIVLMKRGGRGGGG